MKRITKLFCIILVVSIINSPFSNGEIAQPHEKRATLSPQIFSFTDSIYIDNDTAFVSYGFSGNGSYSDPFILEDLWISTNDPYAIRIQNTNSHFIIKDCIFNSSTNGVFLRNIANNTGILTNNSFMNFHQGISLYIENSTFLQIEDNFFSDSKTAIMTRLGTDNCQFVNNSFENISSECFSIRDATNNVIDSNQCSNSSTFLFSAFSSHQKVVRSNIADVEQFASISYSQSCDLLSNLCLNSSGVGIFLDNAMSCNILYNQIDRGAAAIKIVSSSKINVSSNLVDNCIKGLDIRKSDECYIARNNFTKCGLTVEEIEKSQIMNWIVEDNFVNNKLLGFFRNKGTNFIVEGNFGQVILVSCLQVTVQNMTVRDTSMGIGLIFCDYTIIQNCNVYVTLYGFFVYGSNNCTITSSKSNISTYGALFDQSDGCSITNSEIINNEYGIYASLSEYLDLNENEIHNNIHFGLQLHFSDHCNIISNEFSGNTLGVYLNFGSMILIKNNVISSHYPNPNIGNNSAGIYSTTAIDVRIQDNSIFDNENGVVLIFSHYFTIYENRFRDNTVGIRGTEVLDSEISYNWFETNSNYAVILGYQSTRNIVHHNAFIDNNNGNIQALDDGTNNTWYQIEEEEGNFWDNYQGTGNYSIDGSANSYDLYPLKKNPLEKGNNFYYSFFSLVLVIPFIVITLKRHRNRNGTV